MRLFFALWPDDAVRAQLAHWSRELQALCGGRTTPPGNLHVTLAFLGGIEDARVAEIERAAGEVGAPVASLVLDRPGYWKHNRIAWAGASAPPPELGAFVAELREVLRRAGIRFDLFDDRLKVTFVSPQGPAAAAGLKVGDEIVAVDGRQVAHDYYSHPDWVRGPAGNSILLTRADGTKAKVTLADYF